MKDQAGLTTIGKIMLVILTGILLVNGCNSSVEESIDPVSSNSPTATDGDVQPVAVQTAVAETPEPSDADSADLPPEDLKVRQRTMRRRGGVLDLTFDNLEFDIETDQDFERSMLTEDIEALNGQSVIIRGFILGSSVFQRKGIKEFVLVRDNQQCCFGPGAKIYHNVMVEMNEGKSCDFAFRPVEARGKLTIKPWVNPGDGKTYSVFHLGADTVR